jgi:DHA1 family bicyclomycin/chloramphenicol resistance-like MFS transporter
MLPLGYISGTLISSRIGNRAPLERITVIGGGIGLTAVLVQSGLLLSGHLTPLVLFLPGAFLTFAQGLSLPFAQAGAMAIVPRLAATAAGIGLFMQNFMGAGVAQIYGLLADGTPLPLVQISVVMAVLGLISALVPSLLPQPKVSADLP